jgi:hypothetical protein
MPEDQQKVCERCGYAPQDYDFHKACHDYLAKEITEAEWQAALVAAA